MVYLHWLRPVSNCIFRRDWILCYRLHISSHDIHDPFTILVLPRACLNSHKCTNHFFWSWMNHRRLVIGCISPAHHRKLKWWEACWVCIWQYGMGTTRAIWDAHYLTDETIPLRQTGSLWESNRAAQPCSDCVLIGTLHDSHSASAFHSTSLPPFCQEKECELQSPWVFSPLIDEEPPRHKRDVMATASFLD